MPIPDQTHVFKVFVVDSNNEIVDKDDFQQLLPIGPDVYRLHVSPAHGHFWCDKVFLPVPGSNDALFAEYEDARGVPTRLTLKFTQNQPHSVTGKLVWAMSGERSAVGVFVPPKWGSENGN